MKSFSVSLSGTKATCGEQAVKQIEDTAARAAVISLVNAGPGNYVSGTVSGSSHTNDQMGSINVQLSFWTQAAGANVSGNAPESGAGVA